jgi:hypothetical protein
MEGTTLEKSAAAKGEGMAADAPQKPRRGPLKAAIVAMRPQEWVKNLLVYAGLLFSGQFDDVEG